MDNEVLTNEITYTNELQILTEKVDEVIYYQQHQYSASLLLLGGLVSVLVIYLIYKFISNFIDF